MIRYDIETVRFIHQKIATWTQELQDQHKEINSKATEPSLFNLDYSDKCYCDKELARLQKYKAKLDTAIETLDTDIKNQCDRRIIEVTLEYVNDLISIICNPYSYNEANCAYQPQGTSRDTHIKTLKGEENKCHYKRNYGDLLRFRLRDALGAYISQRNKELREAESRVDRLEQENASLKSEYEKMSKALRENEEEHQNLGRTILALSSSLDTLSNQAVAANEKNGALMGRMKMMLAIMQKFEAQLSDNDRNLLQSLNSEDRQEDSDEASSLHL